MAIPPNTNYLYGNTNLPNNNNQIAFAPGSKKDKTLKSLYEMKDMYGDTPAYKKLREQDVDQFNKGKGPLSLPAGEYKGIEGYTANAAGYPRATITDANNIFNTRTITPPNSSAINFGNAFEYLDTNQPPGITGAKMNVPENDLTGYNEHYNMLPEEEKPGFLNFLQNAGINARDFVMNNAARYGGAMGGAQLGSMFGPIGALAGMIGGGIFGNKFTNQPYIGAGNLYDGAGGFTAAQLDRQNALGGYYSDAARNQRRQASRVGNLIERAASGKNFSRNNLKSLGGFTDNQIDDIVGGSTQISPGTFTAASIDQSFSGEEGPSGGSSSSSSDYGTNENFSNETGRGRTGYLEGGIVGLYR
jgi:hypothetical protein